MVTPVLVAIVPVLTSTLWVHEDFHLWMLLLVVPMATLSLFLGCKKHKSRLVMALGILGVGCLASVAAYETYLHSTSALQGHFHCAECMQRELGTLFQGTTLINIFGALSLVGAHARNFLLCRRVHCCHE
jgi:hypothetical protein